MFFTFACTIAGMLAGIVCAFGADVVDSHLVGLAAVTGGFFIGRGIDVLLAKR